MALVSMAYGIVGCIGNDICGGGINSYIDGGIRNGGVDEGIGGSG